MARSGIRDIVMALTAAGLLAGCVEGGGSAGAGGDAATAAPQATKKSGTQDVEAPEVFQATDSALWDGRPSLGGIWVAAPEVTNPERAIMFNPATGKSVTGALFKRERDNPGPRLQLSSDAAEALGILAGQPTEIRVTALRKVEVKEPEPAAPAAGTATATAVADPAKDGDAAAIASAALAAVDADAKPADAAAKPADGKDAADPAAAAAAGTAVAAAAAADGAAAVTEPPKKKTWKERRAEAKAAREAKKKAAAEAKAAAAAAAAAADVESQGEAAAPATAATAAVAPIEAAPLDARDPAALAAKPEPAPKRRTVGETPAPAAEAPAEKPAETVAASGPARPIQVASFSKEDNANRAAQALAKIGITAKPQKSEKGGTAVWGVIVQGDEAMLKKIKDAGFADAYFLK